MSKADDDLVPETVEGYVIGEKKTIEEYTKLDAEDESLAKWKASLGLTSDTNAYPVKAGDNRKVVIVEMALSFPDQGLEPIVINLEDSDGNTLNKDIKFTIKEKSIYQLSIKFRVQHEIITGLKYLHSIKKAGIRVDKLEEPLGSYAPNTTDKPYYEKTLMMLKLLLVCWPEVVILLSPNLLMMTRLPIYHSLGHSKLLNKCIFELSPIKLFKFDVSCCCSL